LGTSIVEALAKQLNARVEILSGPHGTTVSISHETSIADGLRRLNAFLQPGRFSAAVSNIIQTPLDTERILYNHSGMCALMGSFTTPSTPAADESLGRIAADCVCFDAVVNRRASLVVCRRCNLLLKPRRSSRHGRLVRSTHRHSYILRNHNFGLRTACYLLVTFQVVFGVRSARLAIRSHDHHIS
jgi:hypothetical protein